MQRRLAIVVGRKLDYQPLRLAGRLPNARSWHRRQPRNCARRRGESNSLRSGVRLAAITRARTTRGPGLDTGWCGLRSEHLRARTSIAVAGEAPGQGRRMHPNRIFAGACAMCCGLTQLRSPTAGPAELRATGLESRTYLDAGAFAAWRGHAVRRRRRAAAAGAAMVSRHRRRCVRHQCRWRSIRPSTRREVVFIVSNNAAWNIERLTEMNYVPIVGTELAWSDYAVMARAFGWMRARSRSARLTEAIRAAFDHARTDRRRCHARSTHSDAARARFRRRLPALTAWDEAERARRQWTARQFKRAVAPSRAPLGGVLMSADRRGARAAARKDRRTRFETRTDFAPVERGSRLPLAKCVLGLVS